jgi:Flp pilus assembly pilin Flp
MQHTPSVQSLLRRIHENENGAVSIETILIIGAIAIPILIFLLKFGWPRIKDYFNEGMNDLEAERSGVMTNS